MAKFKVGDQVRLVSGGPTMTVERVHEPSILSQIDETEDRSVRYACQWFSGLKLNKGAFSEGSLEAVKDDTKQTRK